jgi:hypothetical protein
MELIKGDTVYNTLTGESGIVSACKVEKPRPQAKSNVDEVPAVATTDLENMLCLMATLI